MDREVHADPARHGRAHDDERAGGVRAGKAAVRRARRFWRTRASASHSGEAARARDRERWAHAAEIIARGGGGLYDGRGRRPRRRRQPGRGRDPGEDVSLPRSRPPHDRVQRRAGSRRARACLRGGRREFLGVAPRRSDGLWQDGGLLRGRRTDAARRPPGADHAARDRADQPVHGPLCGALRREPGRMALGALAARAGPRLAGNGDGGSARRRRRALRAIPALQGARPHRRRRGARSRLQAGRSRPLPGARPLRGARLPRTVPSHPFVGDAVN